VSFSTLILRSVFSDYYVNITFILLSQIRLLVATFW